MYEVRRVGDSILQVLARVYLAGCLSLASGAVAIFPAQAPSPEAARRLEQALDAFLRRTDLPGGTAALAPIGDTVVVVVAAGLADRELGVAMTPRHRMPAGSVGKVFVATLAMSLIEEGVFGLDDSVSRWLGGEAWYARLPNHTAITVRSLLSHTSGIPDHVAEPAFLAEVRRRVTDRADPDVPFSPEELISYVLDRPAVAAVGQAFRYSDTNYILLGLVLERATGRRFESLLSSRLLDPLALDASAPATSRHVPGAAAGYAPASPFGLPVKVLTRDTLVFHPRSEWTGGGLITSAADLARFGRALFGDRTVVHSATLDQMTEPAQGTQGRYGLGVSIARTSLGPMLGHDGQFPGFRSKLAWVRDAGLVVAIQVNGDEGVDLSRAVQDLVRAWRGEALEPSSVRSGPCVPPDSGFEGRWSLRAISGAGRTLPITLDLHAVPEGYRGRWATAEEVAWEVVGRVVSGALQLRSEGSPSRLGAGRSESEGLVAEARRDETGLTGYFSPVVGGRPLAVRVAWSGTVACGS